MINKDERERKIINFNLDLNHFLCYSFFHTYVIRFTRSVDKTINSKNKMFRSENCYLIDDDDA
jgi:hypothetical protein